MLARFFLAYNTAYFQYYIRKQKYSQGTFHRNHTRYSSKYSRNGYTRSVATAQPVWNTTRSRSLYLQ